MPRQGGIYWAGELRLIPHAQALRNWPVLNYFEIDAPFAQVGGVAPQWHADLFTLDLKWDVGVGLRLMTFRIPVHLDFAYGEAASSIRAMSAQPLSRQGS
jgi:hypothetical protein